MENAKNLEVEKVKVCIKCGRKLSKEYRGHHCPCGGLVITKYVSKNRE